MLREDHDQEQLDSGPRKARHNFDFKMQLEPDQ